MGPLGTNRSTTTLLFPSNGALVRACRRGDRLAWQELVDRYERLVYSIALREGLDRDQAAEVTQETFATLVAHLHRLEDPERLASWLMTVARRTTWRVRNRARAGAAPRPLAELETLGRQARGDQGVLVSDSVEELATVEWVYDAVQSLSEPCRSLVTQLFLVEEEPSYAEIAVRLGRPVGSIGPMRGRCLARLRQLLEDAA